MIGKTRFDKLLEPSRIGRARTRNRMVKTGAEMGYGVAGKRSISFYEALARGGVGLIIVESTIVDHPLGMTPPRQFRVDDDKYIPDFNKLTQAIHKHGCPTFLQLLHRGAWLGVSSSSLTLSEMPPDPMLRMPCRGLSIAEIEELVNMFVSAAERAQKAGFDGVEFNASTSHMLNSFLSGFWNRRQDAYGCANLENRARVLVEIIRETKKRLGQGFPVVALINGAEYGIDKGITPEEAQGFAQLIEKAGADAIHVRANGYGDYQWLLTPDFIFYPEPPKHLAESLDGSKNGVGALVPLAAGIKKVVSIPVITVGRLDPFLGEKILREGKADFIGLTRRLFADPELPNKVASGRLEDIHPCMSCGECLRSLQSAVRCRVNAALGSEREYEIKPAEKRKRVVVVGGGPAGMEAARVAALRGHEVILYEKEHKLGGLLPLAAVVKGFEIENLPAIIRYLKIQINKLGVKTKLGREADISVIEEIKPDVVILATGGIPTVPEIIGINKHNVISSPALHRKLRFYLRFLGPRTLRWLTRFWMPFGKRVVIIGGAIQGCELAEFLTKRGRKVTIVDTAKTLGDEMAELRKYNLFRWLARRGATMMTEVRYEEITDKGLTITTKDGKRQTLEADSIIPVMPLTPNNELLKNLEGKAPEIYPIGDCREPHLILEAIADGYRIANTI